MTRWPQFLLVRRVKVGAWDTGPFQNDGALDWVIDLARSGDPGFPARLLRRLEAAKAEEIYSRHGQAGIAAAEAVAASRGWPADPLPAEIQEWLEDTGARADGATAELAVRVIGTIETGSELAGLWHEGGETAEEEHAAVADLRRRLREPPRELCLPPLEKAQVRVGDVVQLLTSAVTAAYIQLIGTTELDLDMIRVMPGLFGEPLDDVDLAALVRGKTAFLSPGSFAGMLGLPGSQPRGNYPVPAACAARQPLKKHPEDPPGCGDVYLRGQRLSAREFARLHPDIDQTMLADYRIPFEHFLLRKIECEWQPWMGDDWRRPYGEEAPVLHPPTSRPEPYPPTAQPGKFLLDPSQTVLAR